MSLYIPLDIAQQIQSYMDNTTYIQSRGFSTSFVTFDSERTYVYDSENVLPSWVTKIIVGDRTTDCLKKSQQLTYIDLASNKKVRKIGIKGLKVLKLGSSEVGDTAFMGLKALKELYIQENDKVTWRCLGAVKLTHLDCGRCFLDGGSIKHMPLEWLDVGRNSSIRGLECMIHIKYLNCGERYSSLLTKITNLPLEYLSIYQTITDINKFAGPLYFPSLKRLDIKQSGISSGECLLRGHPEMKIGYIQI